MLSKWNEPLYVTFLTLCFCSCTFRLPDCCLRFTDGFFQGSLKVICGLARLVFSMLGIQLTACNLGRGIWRTAFPSRKSPARGSQRGLQQSIGGWWCGAWAGGNGSRDSGWGWGEGTGGCRLCSLLSRCPGERGLGNAGLQAAYIPGPLRPELMRRAGELSLTWLDCSRRLLRIFLCLLLSGPPGPPILS